ncbi:hypothetical protein NHP21005_17320 [Helicobacter sp. NHP21005]|nr:hypothetical protein NHP21005_17320 [Helicobacter sp. NHP21005]
MYARLCEEYTEKDIVVHIKGVTRGDERLLWKNIAYGFFRNSILLSLVSLWFSWASGYFYINLIVVVVLMGVTYSCFHYYAQQAIESYKEKGIKKTEE